MKSKKAYIILLIVFAAVIIGAAAGYRAFTGAERKEAASEQKAAEAQSENSTPAAQPEDEAADDASDEDAVPVSESSQVPYRDEKNEPSPSVEKSGESGAAPASGNEENDSASSSGSEEPADAPDFTVETAEGIRARLSDISGKPVIVNFWASWCPPCKSELPYFQEAYNEYGDRIQFMMVDLTDGYRETDLTVQQFIKETGYTFPLFYDRQGNAAEAYDIYSIPVTLGITSEGKLKYSKTGALRAEELDEIIKGLTE